MPTGEEALDTKARRAQQAEATRPALVAAARRLFVEKGYHRTGTEEVVAEAQVGTRVRFTTTSPTSKRCSKPCSSRWKKTLSSLLRRASPTLPMAP